MQDNLALPLNSPVRPAEWQRRQAKRLDPPAIRHPTEQLPAKLIAEPVAERVRDLG